MREEGGKGGEEGPKSDLVSDPDEEDIAEDKLSMLHHILELDLLHLDAWYAKDVTRQQVDALYESYNKGLIGKGDFATFSAARALKNRLSYLNAERRKPAAAS